MFSQILSAAAPPPERQLQFYSLKQSSLLAVRTYKQSLPMAGVNLFPEIVGLQHAPIRAGLQHDCLAGLAEHVDGNYIHKWRNSFQIISSSLPGLTLTHYNPLFDLAVDPGKRHNLAEELPEPAASMKSELREWDASCLRSEEGSDYPAG